MSFCWFVMGVQSLPEIFADNIPCHSVFIQYLVHSKKFGFKKKKNLHKHFIPGNTRYKIIRRNKVKSTVMFTEIIRQICTV